MTKNVTRTSMETKWDTRGDIVEMTSQMLDNPKGQIYPTTKFYDRMEAYIHLRCVDAKREGYEECWSAFKDMSPFQLGREDAKREVLETLKATGHSNFAALTEHEGKLYAQVEINDGSEHAYLITEKQLASLTPNEKPNE